VTSSRWKPEESRKAVGRLSGRGASRGSSSGSSRKKVSLTRSLGFKHAPGEQGAHVRDWLTPGGSRIGFGRVKSKLSLAWRWARRELGLRAQGPKALEHSHDPIEGAPFTALLVGLQAGGGGVRSFEGVASPLGDRPPVCASPLPWRLPGLGPALAFALWPQPPSSRFFQSPLKAEDAAFGAVGAREGDRLGPWRRRDRQGQRTGGRERWRFNRERRRRR